MNDAEYWNHIRETGVHSVVSTYNAEATQYATTRFGTQNYHPLPVTIVRAEGARVFDDEGREYIDCIGAYSAVAHGHLSPFIVQTAMEQLQISTLTSRAVFTPELALFLECVSRYTGLPMVCPMNTGAEAVETAIKLARKWGYVKKKIAKDTAEIIVAERNFHGRTTTIVGFSSESAYKDNFGPFTPGFVMVPFDDIDALHRQINPNTAAVLLEPIQAEAGVIIPAPGYLAAVRQLCSENNVLLIWDEIQTGFGRTGKSFAWQHEIAEPDMICLGKALGGGIIPVSAVAGTRDVLELFRPGDHGSTFGGNPLACVAAVAAIAEMEVLGLAERSRVLGERLRRALSSLGSHNIVAVRGRGLLVGLEISAHVDSEHLTGAFIRSGILTKETRRHTFRFAPPLTIDETIVDEIVQRVQTALNETTIPTLRRFE
jgi:ornithine--oxo-acid transaminase